MSDIDIDEAFAESLVSTCRTAIGDSLRTVVYFTQTDFELLYVRSDLYDGDPEVAAAAKEPFVANERMGFSSQETYNRLADVSDTEPGIGDYQYTVRAFTHGYIGRVIVGDHAVLLTTDTLNTDDFKEVAVSLRKLLAEEPPV